MRDSRDIAPFGRDRRRGISKRLERDVLMRSVAHYYRRGSTPPRITAFHRADRQARLALSRWLRFTCHAATASRHPAPTSEVQVSMQNTLCLLTGAFRPLAYVLQLLAPPRSNRAPSLDAGGSSWCGLQYIDDNRNLTLNGPAAAFLRTAGLGQLKLH